MFSRFNNQIVNLSRGKTYLLNPISKIHSVPNNVKLIPRINCTNRIPVRNITYYTNNHEFINYDEKNNTAKLGITYYAKSSLGEIIFIENDFEIGDNVEFENDVVTLESTKATGVLATPVEGEILEYNQEMMENLEKYNQMDDKTECDYWLVDIKLNNDLDTTELLCGGEYAKYITSLNTD